MNYHPDPAINDEIIEQANEAERFDLSIGYPPRAWTCPCGTSHSRGHFLTVGIHRCMKCGYTGSGGVMHGSALGGAHDRTLLGIQTGSAS
jgi:hypothetical protein